VRILRVSDHHIALRSKLKYLWNRYHSETLPSLKYALLRDIHFCRHKLSSLSSSPRNQTLSQKYGGSFAWKAKELGVS